MKFRRKRLARRRNVASSCFLYRLLLFLRAFLLLGRRDGLVSARRPPFLSSFQGPSTIRSLLRVDDDKTSYKRQKRIPTVCSGYGSKSNPYPKFVNVTSTTTITTAQHSKQRVVEETIHIHHERTNATLYLDPKSNTLLMKQATENGTTTATLVELRNLQTPPNLPNFPMPNLTSCIPLEGIYGVYRIPSGTIFCLVGESVPVLEAPHNILTIRRVQELYLYHVPNNKNVPSSTEEIRQLQLLRKSLKDHDWYFCDKQSLIRDLTHTVQHSLTDGSGTTATPWWQDNSTTRPDSRFFWNQDLLQPFHQLSDSNTTNLLLSHTIPMTSAFCGMQSTNNYTQLLITRRSRHRAGTRFTKRGADPSGNVANFAETEQILVLATNPIDSTTVSIASFVQTRGSIPLLWSSPTDIKTYRPRIRIGTDPVSQAQAMRDHLLEQFSKYVSYNSSNTVPSLLVVNLIDKHSDQGRLGSALDAVLKAVLDIYRSDADYPQLNRKSTKHLWFDFHAQVKAGRWDKLVDLLESVQPSLLQHGFFWASCDNTNDKASSVVHQRQTGVVRTNCMDCLDRTNVVQSIFARYMLFQQLSRILGAVERSQKTAYRSAPMTLPWEDGEVAHRLLWADNADAISRLYAGTPALKGDFTRTGKRTKKGALDDGMNSLQRYYLNNFLDADRQEGMDLMTGYQSFSDFEQPSGMEGDAVPELDDEDEEESPGGLAFHDVTRKMLLGLGPRDGRIRTSSSTAISERDLDTLHHPNGQQPGTTPLSLRWLPGDLKTEVRDKLVSQFQYDSERDLQSTSSLLTAMDQRSVSHIPWWVVEDNSSDDDDNDSDEEALVAELEEVKASALNNPGYLLGAVVVAMQAPLTMAMIVMSLLATTFWPDNR